MLSLIEKFVNIDKKWHTNMPFFIGGFMIKNDEDLFNTITDIANIIKILNEIKINVSDYVLNTDVFKKQVNKLRSDLELCINRLDLFLGSLNNDDLERLYNIMNDLLINTNSDDRKCFDIIFELIKANYKDNYNKKKIKLN